MTCQLSLDRGLPFSASTIADCLEIEEFRHLELGRYTPGDRSKTKDRREVTAPAMNFRKQDSGDRSQTGRIDKQWRGLPLLRGQGDGCEQFPNLFVKGTPMIKMRRDRKNLVDCTPSEVTDSSEMSISERMAEIEQEHG